MNYYANWAVFNKSDVVGVMIGMSVTGPNLPGGTTVSNIRNYDSSRVRIYFTQRTRAGTAGSLLMCLKLHHMFVSRKSLLLRVSLDPETLSICPN